MRVLDETVVEHIGTLEPLETFDATVNVENALSLINPITELYEDAVTAYIREYFTNAWDSHQEAGTVRPVEVELPSELRPVYVVRDYGVGLSEAEIVERYLCYGLSSKTETDDQVGMLGFGCKSALAYTSQFTVTAVKNGHKVQVLIRRKESGLPTGDVLFRGATNEPNGVEIKIPVKAPIQNVVDKAYKFFRFSEPGCVLVNGQKPESYFDGEDDDNLFLDPDVIIAKYPKNNRGYRTLGIGQDYIVMGNVPYPCKLDHGLRADVIVRVAIGDVVPTPSREALKMDNPRTKYALEQAKKFVQERLQMHIQREIDNKPTRKEAVREAVRWGDILINWRNRPTYKGMRLPAQLPMVGQEWTTSRSWGRNSAASISYVNISTLVDEGTYVMVGHPNRSMIKETKDEIKKKFPQAQRIIVVWQMRQEFRDWLEATEVFEYDDVRPLALPRGSGPRANGSWKYTDGGGKWLVWDVGVKFKTEDIPTTYDKPIVYLLKSESGNAALTRDSTRRRLGELLFDIHGGKEEFRLVLLAKSQEEQFKKLHPAAVHFTNYFQQFVDEKLGALTEDQFWWGMDGDDRSRSYGWMMKLDRDEILDPDVVAVLNRMHAAGSAHHDNRALQYVCLQARNVLVRDVTVKGRHGRDIHDIRWLSKSTLKDAIQTVRDTYPLLEPIERQCAENVDYLNALYLYRKGQC